MQPSKSMLTSTADCSHTDCTRDLAHLSNRHCPYNTASGQSCNFRKSQGTYQRDGCLQGMDQMIPYPYHKGNHRCPMAGRLRLGTVGSGDRRIVSLPPLGPLDSAHIVLCLWCPHPRGGGTDHHQHCFAKCRWTEPHQRCPSPSTGQCTLYHGTQTSGLNWNGLDYNSV
jgi:hypothetical protein